MSSVPAPVPRMQHSPALGGEVVLDDSVLSTLIELGGEDDPGLVRDLIELFRADADARVEAIRVACEQDDAETMARAAHALKSSSASLGALAFAEACRDLERAVTSAAGIDEAARRVIRMFPEVMSALDALPVA